MRNIIIAYVFIFAALAWLGESSAFAASTIAYHGRIVKPDGSAFEPNSATLKVQVRSTGAEDCLMYEETYSGVDMTGTGGVFSLKLNSGTGTRTDVSGLTFSQVFSNLPGSLTVPLALCTGGTNTITMTSSSHRIVRLSFKDATMPLFEQVPDMALAYVPFALDAQKLSGFGATNLLRVADGSGPQTTTPLTPANFTELMALLNGTSTQYEAVGNLNGSAIPSLSNGDVLQWNGGGWTAVSMSGSETDPTVRAYAKADLPTCGANEFLQPTGVNSWTCAAVSGATGGTVTAVTIGSGLVDGTGTPGTTINTTGTIALPDLVTAGTGTKVSYDAKGRITSSAPLAESDIPSLSTAGKVSGDAITSGTIGGSTSINTTGTIATSALTSGATSVSSLILRDGDTNTITLQTPSDVTADYVLTLPPNDGASGEVLTTDGSGVLTWTSLSASGAVTSISSTAPITIGGTATAPVIGVSAATTAASGVVVLAADGGTTASTVVQATDSRLSDSRAPSGTAGGDLSGTYPNPSVAKLQGFAVDTATPLDSQVMRYTGGGTDKWGPAYISFADLKKADGTSQMVSASCTSSQTLNWSSITDVFTCTDIAIDAADIADIETTLAKIGGNTVTGTMVLGTNSTHSFAFETDGTTRMTIDTSGNVGVGTSNPLNTLDLGSVSPIITMGTNSALMGNLYYESPSWKYRGDGYGGYMKFNPSTLAGGSIEFGITSANNTSGAGAAASPVSVMNIMPSGNIGLGTTGPGTKLDVAGAITSRPYGTNTGETGQFILRELAANGTETATIRAPDAITTSYVLTLPGDDGNSGDVLTTNGSGVLSWAPAGSATSVAAGDGSAASPSIGFSSDPNTGFYSAGADQIGVSANGANIFTMSSAGMVAATNGGGVVTTAAGTASAPTFSFAGDTDTGWYSPAADTLAAATGGTERVRIDSTGKVGIGTTSPAYLFDIQKAVSSNQFHLSGTGNDDGGYIFANASGIAISSNSAFDGTNWIAKSTGANSIQMINGGINFTSNTSLTGGNSFTPTVRMTILNSGNIGIGTTNPSQKLQVAGTTTGIQVGDTGSGMTFTTDSVNSAIANKNGSQLFYNQVGTSDSSTAYGFHATTSDTRVLSILNNGNVGIGTSGPGTLLDVAGAITSRPYGTNTGETGQFILRELAANGTDSVTIRAPDALAAAYTLTLPGDDGNSGDVLTTNGSGVLSWAPAGSATSVAAGAGSAAAPSIGFSGDPDTGFYSAGADQIGVAANGTNIFTMSSAGMVAATNGGGVVTTAAGTASAPTFSFAGDTDTGWYSPAADTLAAATGGTERVRIDSTGKVGIGTTSPNQELDVRGDVRATGFDFQDASGTPMTDAWIGTSAAIDAGLNKWLHIGGITDNTDGTGAKRRVAIIADNTHFSGNIGIATTAPDFGVGYGSMTRVLGITGDGSASAATSGVLALANNRATPTAGDTVGSVDYISVGNGSGSAQLGARIKSVLSGSGGANGMGQDLVVYTKGDNAAGISEKMRITSAGNVGIGTTNPSYLLQVHSVGSTRSDISLTNSTTGSSGSDGLNITQLGNTTYITNRENNDIIMNTGSGTALRLVDIGGSSGVNYLTIKGANTGNSPIINAAGSDTDVSITLTPKGVGNTIFSSGNVGIGTTSPGTLLDVAGAITSRPYGTSSGNTGQIILRELAASGTNTATIRAPDALAADYVLTLPADDGNNGEVLTTNGSGVLTWTTPGGSVSNNSLDFSQFEDTLDLDAALILNQTTNTWTQTYTGTTGTGYTYTANSLTTGTAMAVSSSSMTTGSLLTLTDSYNNASSTGAVQKITVSGTSAAAVPLMITNAGTGASFRVNDDGTDADTTPFIINSSGNVGIGTTTPTAPLHIRKDFAGTDFGGAEAAFVLENQDTSSDTNINRLAIYQTKYNLIGSLIQSEWSWSGGAFSGNNQGFLFLGQYGGTLGLHSFGGLHGGGQTDYTASISWGEIGWKDGYVNVNHTSYVPTPSNLMVHGNMTVGAAYSGQVAAPANGLIIEGNVGIGTSSPGTNTKLRVQGQIASKSGSTTTGAIDFVNGNAITTSFDCGSNITLANIRDGGSYTLVVTGTGTTQCSFSTSVTGDDAATVSYRFNPANGTRTSSSHTVYSLLRVGSIVYVSWISGF